MPKGKPAFGPAFTALSSFGNRPVHCEEIAARAGLDPESVNNSFINHLSTHRSNGTIPAVVRVASKTYRVNNDASPANHRNAFASNDPAPAPTTARKQPKTTPIQDELFERLGTTGSGVILVRAVDSQTIYELKEL